MVRLSCLHGFAIFLTKYLIIKYCAWAPAYGKYIAVRLADGGSKLKSNIFGAEKSTFARNSPNFTDCRVIPMGRFYTKRASAWIAKPREQCANHSGLEVFMDYRP